MKHRFHPIALNLHHKPCLVIGVDAEIIHKSQRLFDSGAIVTLVGAPMPPEADRLEAQGITVWRRPFQLEDLTDQFFVLLSFKVESALAEAVAHRCRERRILLAALDRPHLCDVIQLALFDRGRLKIGISTEGASPGLARKIREGLERSLAEEPVEAFLDHLAALRERLEHEIPDFAERRRALLAAVEGFDFRAALTFPPSWAPAKKP